MKGARSAHGGSQARGAAHPEVASPPTVPRLAYAGLASLLAVFLAAPASAGIGAAVTWVRLSYEGLGAVHEPSGGALAVGLVLPIEAEVVPLTDAGARGAQTYVTFYLPANVEVVGARVMTTAGASVPLGVAGLAYDGCGRTCPGYDTAPSSSGTVNLDDGAISQALAETGIFYAALPHVPATGWMTVANGDAPVDTPTGAGALVTLLELAAAPTVHSPWDADQIAGLGIAAAPNAGVGNTPHRHGSPVAGPHTHYGLQVDAGPLFDGTPGPWSRVTYPGARVGQGNAATAAGTLGRTDAAAPNTMILGMTNPVPATAIRFALGEARAGVPQRVQIFVRYSSLPGNDAGRTFCAEAFTAADTRDNPWSSYVTDVRCALLDLPMYTDVSRVVVASGDSVSVTMSVINPRTTPLTNVVLRIQTDPTKVSIVDPGGGSAASCAFPSGSTSCLEWPYGTIDSGGDIYTQLTFQFGAGGTLVHRPYVELAATELAQPLQMRLALQNVAPVINLTCADPSAVVAPAQATSVNATLSNTGTRAASLTSIIVTAPAGFTIDAATLSGSSLTPVSGVGTARAEFGSSAALAQGQSRPLIVTLTAPSAPTLGAIDIEVRATATPAAFATTFPAVTHVPVAAGGVSVPAQPSLTCFPIFHGQLDLAGTAGPGQSVELYGNARLLATTTADPSGAFSFAFVHPSPLMTGMELRVRAVVSGVPSPLSSWCNVGGPVACADGRDNNGDGAIDYPADPECASPADTSEVTSFMSCSNGDDDDGDGLVDWPADPGCDHPRAVEDDLLACADGSVDNDGDGFADFGSDLQCTDIADAREHDVPACQDGVDDDSDGLWDFQADGTGDPGCQSWFDDDEEDGVEVAGIPRLVVIVDTSGSMNGSVCGPFTGGDGSAECPGANVDCATCGLDSSCSNALADDSRLFKVKGAVRTALFTRMARMEVALLRFKQQARVFACPSTNATSTSGGWQGSSEGNGCPGYAEGEVMVGFGPDANDLVIRLLDGSSGAGLSPMSGLDEELRGSGTTPLAGALLTARAFITDARARETSAHDYHVLLLTDGLETCAGDPAAAAASLAADGIPVTVFGFAVDAIAQVQLDAIASAGGTDSAVVTNNVSLLTADLQAYFDAVAPILCNGINDLVEGFPVGDPCDGDDGDECGYGTYTCNFAGDDVECVNEVPAELTEICNGEDDDCDLVMDDGLPDDDGDGVCNGMDPCPQTPGSTCCLIASTEWVNGAVDPQNPCQECRALTNATAWTPDDANPCSDGLDCTTGDRCATGACVADPVVCPPPGSDCFTAECHEGSGCVDVQLDPGTVCGGASVTCNAGELTQPFACDATGACQPSAAVQSCAPYLGCADANRCATTCTDTCADGFACTGAICRPDSAPTARAGDDLAAVSGEVVSLDGRASTDPEHDPLVFAWEQTAGPEVMLTATTVPAPRFAAPAVDAETVLSFELRVRDAHHQSAADTIEVTVRPFTVPSGCSAGAGTVLAALIAALALVRRVGYRPGAASVQKHGAISP